MESRFKVTVIPGKVVINSGLLVYCSEFVEIWSFDFRSKYAELLSYGWGPDGLTVSFTASDRTLYIDTLSISPTDINFEHDDGANWNVLAEGGRYGWTVVLYKEATQLAEDIDTIYFEFRELWNEDNVSE